jgi:WD40 repeat protein
MRSAGHFALACLLAAGMAAGCQKEKQSLVLAKLRLAAPNPAAASLTSLRISVNGGSVKLFDLSGLPDDATTTFGVYVDGDVTGAITVDALASSGCTGFHGTGTGSIPAAESKVSVDVLMQPYPLCASDGGVAGSGGATGTAGAGGGAAGSGGPGGAGGQPSGQVPSLTSCRTFDHVGQNCSSNTYVVAVAISPDGKTVATGGDSFNDQVKIWSFDGRTLTATGKILAGHTGGLAFSPDGSRLAVVDGSIIRMWNTSNWSAGTSFKGSGSDNMVGVGFTPNGQRVVSADHAGFSGGNLYVHAVTGGEVAMITQHVDEEPASLGVSPKPAGDGSVGVVVGTYYGSAHVFTLGAGAFTGPVKVMTIADSRYGVSVVRFSPDGSLFVTSDQVTRFWKYPEGTALAPDTTFGDAAGLDFSPDGRYLVAAGTFTTPKVSLIAVSNHAETARYTPTDSADSVAFSPSGTAIVGGLDACGKVFVCSD